MVFGVGPNGIYLTNPLESVSEDLVSEQLCRDIRWTFVQFLSYQSGRDIGHWLWILLLLAGDVERKQDDVIEVQEQTGGGDTDETEF